MTIKDKLDKYGRLIVSDLQKSMAKKGLNATGATSKSIRYEVTDNRLTIFAPEHIGALEFGRKPTSVSGSGELRKALIIWAKARGIPESAVYAIARKIHEKGIKVPNKFNKGGVISDVINKELIEDIKKDISDSYVLQVNEVILKNGNFN